MLSFQTGSPQSTRTLKVPLFSPLGYDSGAHSPTSETPSTPPRCLMMTQVDNDGSSSSTGDITSPHDQVRPERILPRSSGPVKVISY